MFIKIKHNTKIVELYAYLKNPNAYQLILMFNLKTNKITNLQLYKEFFYIKKVVIINRRVALKLWNRSMFVHKSEYKMYFPC
jgi:hypothetical protein